MAARREELVVHVESDSSGGRVNLVDISAERIGRVQQTAGVEGDRVESAPGSCTAANVVTARDCVTWRCELQDLAVAEVIDVEVAVGSELHAERDVSVETDGVLEAAVRPEDVDVVDAREVERRRVDVSRRVGGDAFRVARLASR